MKKKKKKKKTHEKQEVNQQVKINQYHLIQKFM